MFCHIHVELQVVQDFWYISTFLIVNKLQKTRPVLVLMVREEVLIPKEYLPAVYVIMILAIRGGSRNTYHLLAISQGAL